jgi:2-polyprenyl-6-methoxyphenol hydroxylase-like FAD-dependent oxidoreductase
VALGGLIVSEVRKVLIVGGGVGGLSLSIRLRRMEIAVEIAEIDPTWRAVGAGLTLNGATLRAFRKVGVLDKMRQYAHVHGGRRTHDLQGNVISDVPAYVPEDDDLRAGGGILRPVLHQILTEEALALGVNARLGLTVDTLTQSDGGVDVVFSDGATGRYDLVVGADGLRSKVRSLVFPDAPQPKFTGQGCWRAVFPRPPEVATGWAFVDRSHKAGFNPVSQDEMYMYLLESAPGNPWHEEKDWPALLGARMAEFGGLVAELGKTLDETSRINYRPLEGLLMDPPWHRGRVVLIGDAAHATTPHAGYGAGLSVEDAVVLSEELAVARPLEDILLRYVERRYERCRRVLQGSLKIGELEQARAPVEEQTKASMELGAYVREGADA